MQPESGQRNTIILASKNPVKVQAVLMGFQSMFPGLEWEIQGVAAASGVPDQPLSDDETLLGALNRAQNAARLHPSADFWVGVEGGLQEHGNELAAFAWVVVRSKKMVGKGRTATFFLPGRVAELVRQGKELGDADDIVFQRSNSKQENGAIGILTGNVIDRALLYQQAVIIALIPHKNPQFFLPLSPS
jgi:inosine/xanthosine triphosphatase